MDKIITSVRLIGLSGSLRKASFSRATLAGLRNTLPENVRLEIRDLQLPLYNEDEDGPAGPAAVLNLRQAIADSDGVVIVTPEYNHGMSGVLKNALDWASRPFGRSTLARKPVLTMTASPAFTGGVRAQQQMNETLLSIPARPVLRPPIL